LWFESGFLAVGAGSALLVVSSLVLPVRCNDRVNLCAVDGATLEQRARQRLDRPLRVLQHRQHGSRLLVPGGLVDADATSKLPPTRSSTTSTSESWYTID
jgi:hypothetical protein